MPDVITVALNNASVSAAPGAPGKIGTISVDAVDYTDPDVAHITGSAPLPSTLNSFDGCECFRTIGGGEPDPLGHQYHLPGAAGPFAFDFRLTRPSADQTWRIWFVSRNAQNEGQLVTASGLTQTPYVDVAVTARPLDPGAPGEPQVPSAVTVTVLDHGSAFGIRLGWTLPSPLEGTVAYDREVRYFNDAAGTSPDSDWIALGQISDGSVSVADAGPFPRPEANQWIRGRVRGVNADNQASAWATSAAMALVEPLAIPPAAASVALTVDTETRAGVPSFRLSFTITEAGTIGSTEGYLAEARYFSNSGATTAISDWIALGWVDRLNLTYDTAWFGRSVNQWVKVRVAGQNALSQIGPWVESSAQNVPASGGLDGGAMNPGTLGAGLAVSGGQLLVPPLGITNTMIGLQVVAQANLVNSQIVDAARLVDFAVSQQKLQNAQIIDSARIVDLAVTTAKIANLAVDNAKIANLAVNGAKIANLAVDTTHIANAAITQAKIANLAVGTAQIADLAVTDAKISSLTANKIAAGTISASISLTAPTISVTGSGFTVNIDSSNGIKLTRGTGTVSLLNGYVECSIGVFSPSATFSSSGMGVIGPTQGTCRLQVVTEPVLELLTTGGTATRIYPDRQTRMNVEGPVQINGLTVIDGSRNYRFHTVFFESLSLASLTTSRTVPVYDGTGNYIGKIPIIP